MSKITFEFTGDGVQYNCENVSGADIAQAITIMAHDLKKHGVPDDLIKAAVHAGIDDTVFKAIMSGDESPTN